MQADQIICYSKTEPIYGAFVVVLAAHVHFVDNFSRLFGSVWSSRYLVINNGNSAGNYAVYYSIYHCIFL